MFVICILTKLGPDSGRVSPRQAVGIEIHLEHTTESHNSQHWSHESTKSNNPRADDQKHIVSVSTKRISATRAAAKGHAVETTPPLKGTQLKATHEVEESTLDRARHADEHAAVKSTPLKSTRSRTRARREKRRR